MAMRKNAATLSSTEKQNFVNAVLTLKKTTLPGHVLNRYDEFVAIHWGVCMLMTGVAAGTNGGHGGPAFLPWHREFICRFEKTLQSVDPTVTLPYWNWSSGNASDTTSIFTDDFMGPAGTGALGEISSGHFTVANGWVINSAVRPQGYGQALRRNNSLNPNSLPVAAAASALTDSDFYSFRSDLEVRAHNPVHNWVGGNMSWMTSPNDPIFFLHHANVDRLWAIWQQTHPGSSNYNPLNQGPYGHRIDDRMWPWDGGQSSPGMTTGDPSGPDEDLTQFLPSFPSTDIVTPRMVLDHIMRCTAYDTDPVVKHKPEIKEIKDHKEIKEKEIKEIKEKEIKEHKPEIKEIKEHKEIKEKEIKEIKEKEIKEHKEIKEKEIKEIKEKEIKEIKEKEHKEIKEKEHKEIKEKEHKEIKEKEIKEHKEIKEKDKDIVEGPPQVPQTDPMIIHLSSRIDNLEKQLSKGAPFIQPEERPDVGKKILKKQKTE